MKSKTIDGLGKFGAVKVDAWRAGELGRDPVLKITSHDGFRTDPKGALELASTIQQLALWAQSEPKDD